MLYFTDKELDDLLIEDVPYSDLTTSFLRIENKPGKIQVSTRDSTVVCCTEEVMKIFKKLGIKTTLFTPSGEQIEKDVKFLEGEGLTRNLHGVARIVDNLIGYASGIATRTRQIVEIVRSISPDTVVATTRKMTPLTRKIAVKAVKAGGATIHRMGLSESILILNNHLQFLGGLENLKERIVRQRTMAGGRPVCVEVNNAEDAFTMADTDIEMIQLDKFSPREVKNTVESIRDMNTCIKIAVAGGITDANIAEYAASGADLLITSWPYYGAPSDLIITLQPVNDLY